MIFSFAGYRISFQGEGDIRIHLCSGNRFTVACNRCRNNDRVISPVGFFIESGFQFQIGIGRDNDHS